MCKNRSQIRAMYAINAQQGFSIIEMMIAVTILAIAATVAVPAYSQFIGNTQIRSTTESIKNGIQLARAEAVKRNARVIFTLAANTSWSVGCTVVDAVNCPLVIQSKAANEGSAGSVSVALVGNNNITFTSLGTLDTNVLGQLSQVNIDHKTIPAQYTKDLRIIIGAGGNVRMCDPNVSATTDTRRC